MRLFLRGIARGTLFLVQASCCIEGNHYCENTSTIEWIDCYCKFCIAFKTSASFSQQTLLFMHSDTIIFTLSFYRAVYSCHCAVSLSLSYPPGVYFAKGVIMAHESSLSPPVPPTEQIPPPLLNHTVPQR